MILSKAENNKFYVVKKIVAKETDKRKLYKLGVYLKQKILLVTKIAGGGVIISVEGADMIIGKNVADKIWVQLC